MEKEFIGYNEALALKELGFDEPCLTYYEEDKYLKQVFILQYNKFELFSYRNLMFENENTKDISAPTFSQAFRWFRKKHGIHSFIDIYPQPDEPERCWYMLRYFERGEKGKEDYMSGWFINQDKAELACLKKLISIVKNK